jgi:hypothetical protein
MIRFLARLFTPLAVALLTQPPVRHALIRAVAEQQQGELTARQTRRLNNQLLRKQATIWFTASENARP